MGTSLYYTSSNHRVTEAPPGLSHRPACAYTEDDDNLKEIQRTFSANETYTRSAHASLEFTAVPGINVSYMDCSALSYKIIITDKTRRHVPF